MTQKLREEVPWPREDEGRGKQRGGVEWGGVGGVGGAAEAVWGRVGCW